MTRLRMNVYRPTVKAPVVHHNIFRRMISHPQTIISAAQAIEITLSCIGAWALSLHGMDPVTLLIMGKVELFFLSVPMHILTLHLARIAR